MRRSAAACLLALGATLLAAPVPDRAVEVVILKTKDLTPYNQAIEGFQRVCKAPTTVFDMKGDDKQDLALVEQIQALRPAVILAIGSKSAKISKEKLPEIPLIFCMVRNPERQGLLGPSSTGVRLQVPYSMQFSLLKAVAPWVKVVGVLYDPAKTEDDVNLATHEAAQVGLKLVLEEVTSEKEVQRGLRKLLGMGIDMLWLTADDTVLGKTTFARIVAVTRARNVPVMAYHSGYVMHGASLAVEPSYSGIGEQAGTMAIRILSATKVSDIPVEPPESLRVRRRGDTFGLPVQEIFGIDIR